MFSTTGYERRSEIISCNSPYRISAKFVPECITSSASGIFCSHANFRSHSFNLSFLYACFNSTLCSDCLQFNSLVHSSWMIAKVSEHHGDYWRRIHKILSVDLENYRAISETRWKAQQLSADYTTWKHAGGSHARTQPEVVLCANHSKKRQ